MVEKIIKKVVMLLLWCILEACVVGVFGCVRISINWGAVLVKMIVNVYVD